MASLTLIDFSLYTLAGALAGTLSGLLGIGGGLVVVPILAFIYGHQGMPEAVIMQLAAGTSFAAMLVTTTFSTRAHYKRGATIWAIYKALFLWIIMGTLVGAFIADSLHSNFIQHAFGVFTLIMAIKIVLPERKAKTHKPAHPKLPNSPFKELIAFLIGIPSGLLGIGNSASLLPYLTHLGFNIRDVIGVSSALSFTTALIGSISFWVTGMDEPNMPREASGYIYWPAVLGIILTSPIFATLGAKLSHFFPKKYLKYSFTIFLLSVSVHMFYR